MRNLFIIIIAQAFCVGLQASEANTAEQKQESKSQLLHPQSAQKYSSNVKATLLRAQSMPLIKLAEKAGRKDQQEECIGSKSCPCANCLAQYAAYWKAII